MTARLPPGLQLEKVDDRIMTLNVGPQHPGSGHMRLIIQVDGDRIVSCDPDPGYVHRGEEKMAEYRNYITNIPHLERPVIHDSCNILYPYCLGVEELLGLEVSERANFEDVCLRQINYLEKRLKAYADIFYDNPILIARTEKTGVLSREDAIRLGTTGTVLRASGVDYDVRTKEPYDVYDELDVHTNVLKNGDSYDRSKTPWLDMLESCNIIRQALEKMPKSGSVRVKLKPNPKGGNDEVYKRVESGRGSLGAYIVSRSKPEPYRVKLSVGSFRNLICMPYLLKGEKLGNMPAVYWSLNYWPVEADR